MKVWLGALLPGVAVSLAFAPAGQIDSFWWRWLALTGGFILLQAFFVQKYPRWVSLRWVSLRWVSLRWAMKLKPGQKVEVEGK